MLLVQLRLKSKILWIFMAELCQREYYLVFITFFSLFLSDFIWLNMFFYTHHLMRTHRVIPDISSILITEYCSKHSVTIKNTILKNGDQLQQLFQIYFSLKKIYDLYLSKMNQKYCYNIYIYIFCIDIFWTLLVCFF